MQATAQLSNNQDLIVIWIGVMVTVADENTKQNAMTKFTKTQKYLNKVSTQMMCLEMT